MNISMRLYQRDNGVWYIEAEGGQRRSLKTRDTATAASAYRKILQAYRDAKIARITGECRTTLGEFRRKYDAWSEDALPAKTGRANRLGLKTLERYAGASSRLDRVGQRHVDDMIADLRRAGRTARTINHYIRHARAALNRAVAWEMVHANPLRAVREIQQPKLRPRYLTRAEIPRFLASISDPSLRRLATAFVATGRRLSEVLHLRWSDIEGGRYWVRTKGGDARSFRINRLFRAVLDAQTGENPDRVFGRWTHPDSVSHAIKRALVAFGRADLSTHSLRHTYAALKAGEGLSLRELQGLLGHSEMRTTEIYAHLTADHLDDLGEVEIGPVDLQGKIRAKK